MSDNNGENNKVQEAEPQSDSAVPESPAASTTGVQQKLAKPEEPRASQTETTSPQEQTAEPALEPFEEMQKREYNHAVDEGIRRGTQKVSERFATLASQEQTPTEVAKDALGNTSDHYEKMMNAIYAGNYKALADTKEGVYQLLYDLDFTEMRKLEAIKQEYNQN